MTELIENPTTLRYTALPIEDKILFDFLEKQQKSHWLPHEIDNELPTDIKNFARLDHATSKFILSVIHFFAVSDSVVAENIGDLGSGVYHRDILMNWSAQNAMETIHNITYSKLAVAYSNDDTFIKLAKSTAEHPTITAKIDWVRKYVGDSSAPLGRRIVANTIMEGVFFSGSFCAIFWINDRYGGKFPALVKSNEFISRDEGLHTEIGVHIYKTYIKNRLTVADMNEMMRAAVDIEANYIKQALPDGLEGMNADLMKKYIQYVADNLLVSLGYQKIYKVANPFTFMNKISIGGRIADFFAENPSSYSMIDTNLNIANLDLDDETW